MTETESVRGRRWLVMTPCVGKADAYRFVIQSDLHMFSKILLTQQSFTKFIVVIHFVKLILLSACLRLVAYTSVTF